MTFDIRLFRAAARDVAEARDWYESQRTGLGSEYLNEVEATLARIGKAPRSYPFAQEGVRRALVRRFPFAIYFRHHDELVRVIAVLHQSRSPRVWQRRSSR